MATWGEWDGPAALSFFRTLPAASEIALQAAAALGEGMARVSSRQALDWALTLPADDTGWQARHAVLAQWAAQSPSQAMQAVCAMTDPAERTRHIGTLLPQWAATHSDAAESWARHLPHGPDHDQAMNALADSYAIRQPAKALELALEIGSPTLRTTTAENVLAFWREADRAAAEQWLAHANLGKALQEALSEPHDPPENHEP
jgi:hypothetical protein